MHPTGWQAHTKARPDKWAMKARSTGFGQDAELAVDLARGFDADLDVLAKHGEQFQEACEGEFAQETTHEAGNLGLVDAEAGGGLALGEALSVEDGDDASGQLGLGQKFARLGKTEVGENILAASDYGCVVMSGFHGFLRS